MTNKKTDRERAEELLAGLDDFEHGSDEQIVFITQALAEIRKECEAGWLPIESAPKDGTEILIYSPDRRQIFQAAFVPECGQYEAGWQAICTMPSLFRERKVKPYRFSGVTKWKPLQEVLPEEK